MIKMVILIFVKVWRDVFLKWDTDTTNVTYMIVKSDKIWTPDVSVRNRYLFEELE